MRKELKILITIENDVIAKCKHNLKLKNANNFIDVLDYLRVNKIFYKKLYITRVTKNNGNYNQCFRYSEILRDYTLDYYSISSRNFFLEEGRE